MLLTCISSDLATAKPFFFYLFSTIIANISSSALTWYNLESSKRPMQSYGLENRDDFLQKSVISNEREFWIGKAIYKKLTPWIEKIGI